MYYFRFAICALALVVVSPLASAANQAHVVKLPVQSLASEAGELLLDFKLPAGYKLNAEAPHALRWSASPPLLKFGRDFHKLSPSQVKLPYRLPVIAKPGQTLLKVEADLYYCKSENDLCLIDRIQVQMPLQIKVGGAKQRKLTVPVLPPPKEGVKALN